MYVITVIRDTVVESYNAEWLDEALLACCGHDHMATVTLTLRVGDVEFPIQWQSLFGA